MNAVSSYLALEHTMISDAFTCEMRTNGRMKY